MSTVQCPYTCQAVKDSTCPIVLIEGILIQYERTLLKSVLLLHFYFILSKLCSEQEDFF